MLNLPWRKKAKSDNRSWTGRPAKVTPITRTNERPKFNLFSKLKPRFSHNTDMSPSMQMGAKLREQRAKQKHDATRGKVAATGRKYLKFGLLGVLLLIIAAVIGGAVYYLNREQVYILKDITVEGNKAISELEIVSELSDLKGKSLLTFTTSDVENRLKAKFPYIKEAFVRKILPGKLEVQIKERFPTTVYINLSGSYLVDDDRVVVGVVASDDVVPFTADEQTVLDGYGDINANYVFEQYLTRFQTDAEKSKVVWEQVSDDDKHTALNELRANLQAKLDAEIQKHEQATTQAGWSTLRMMEGSDATDYKTGDKFSQTKFDLVHDIAKYMSDQQLTVSRYIWDSDFSLRVQLTSRQLILFTTTKSLDKQLNALEALRTQGALDGASEVDLRSELVAVR